MHPRHSVLDLLVRLEQSKMTSIGRDYILKQILQPVIIERRHLPEPLSECSIHLTDVELSHGAVQVQASAKLYMWKISKHKLTS